MNVTTTGKGKKLKVRGGKNNTRSKLGELKGLSNPGNTSAKATVKEYDTVTPSEA